MLSKQAGARHHLFADPPIPVEEWVPRYRAHLIMSGMAVDVAVIGFSVAGVAAALESSSLGREVALFEHSWDNIPLVESVLIGPTPLTGEVATGPGFEEAARRACAELGVTFHAGRIVAAVDRARDGGFLLASTEE